MENTPVKATRYILPFMLIVLYLTSPLFLPEYWRYLVLIMSILIIVVQGLNVMIGFAGLFSFGQPGFMVFGAYFGAILATRMPWLPFPVVLIAVATASALIGVVIGFPCLRLQGFYLAMATFGFSSAVFQIINYLEPLTGGNDGMYAPSPAIAGIKLGSTRAVLFITAVCVILVQLIVREVDRSRTGRAWKAIRDDEIAASSMGINLRREKLKAFAFGAALAGVAGLLYSYAIKYLEVSYFSLMGLSFFLIMVIGGTGRIYGPIFGSIFITMLPQVLGGRFSQNMNLVYGIVLVFFILLAPEGFYGIWQRIKKLLQTGRYARNAAPSTSQPDGGAES
jgi:branched-chain amino acid transport system permease protein